MYQDALTYQDQADEYNYITDDMLTVREPEGPDHSLIDFPVIARTVVPLRRADERLIQEETEGSWTTAQLIQTIQSVFGEMFEAGRRTDGIKKKAQAWIDSLTTSALDDEALEMGTAHLQGIIEACQAGEKFGVAKWWPGRQGYPHARAEAPQAPQEPQPKGAWYWSRTKKNLRVLARKAGQKVEILEPKPEQQRCKPYIVESEQAKNLLALEHKAGDKIQGWANLQWELAQ